MQFSLKAGNDSGILDAGQTFGSRASGQAPYQVVGDDFMGVVEGRLYDYDWEVIDTFTSDAGVSRMRFFPFGPNMFFRFRCVEGTVRVAMGH